MSAFSRILRDSAAQMPSNIVYDETPIHVYIKQIHERLLISGQLPMSELFQGGMHKSQMIGIFLAVLELVRHHSVQCNQNELFGEMWLVAGDETSREIDATDANSYEHTGPADDDSGR